RRRRSSMTRLETIAEELNDGVRLYLDTVSQLKDPSIQAERGELLSAPGSVVAEPYLELLEPYRPSRTTHGQIETEIGRKGSRSSCGSACCAASIGCTSTR